MFTFFTNLRLRHNSVRELSRLSDRELEDIGVYRADIKSVARFAAGTTHNEASATSASRPASARVGGRRSVEQGRLALQG